MTYFTPCRETIPRMEIIRKLVSKNIENSLPTRPKVLRILDVGSCKNPIFKNNEYINISKCELYEVDLEDSKKKNHIKAELESWKPRFKKEFFDIIIFAEVLEHLRQPVTMVKKLLPYLKKDGLVVISVPNICRFRNRIKLLLGKYPDCAYSELEALWWKGELNLYDAHIVDWNLEVLTKFAKHLGLEVLDVSTNGMIIKGKVIPCRPTLGESLIMVCKI